MEQVSYGRANREELPLLQELLNACFAGVAAECALMLQECPTEAIPVARVGGTPRAMLLALPVTVQLGQQQYPGRYLYGVATHPEWQGKGLCTGLLEYTHREMARQGERFALLLPDSEANRRYYAKRGYRGCQRVAWEQYTDAPGTMLPLMQADPKAYAAARRALCGDAMLWGEAGMAMQQRWLQLYGGALWLLGGGKLPSICAATDGERENAALRELLCPPEWQEQALHTLCQALGVQTLCYPTEGEGQDAREGAMLLEVTPDKIWKGQRLYCALTME